MVYANSSPFPIQTGSQPAVTAVASFPSGAELRLISAPPQAALAVNKSWRPAGDRSGQPVAYASFTSDAGRETPVSMLTSVAARGLPQIRRTVSVPIGEKQCTCPGTEATTLASFVQSVPSPVFSSRL